MCRTIGRLQNTKGRLKGAAKHSQTLEGRVEQSIGYTTTTQPHPLDTSRQYEHFI